MKLIQWLASIAIALPLLAQAGEDGKARIVTHMSNGAQCISPVHILRIDGREVQVNRGGFELEPGKHTMSGKTLIDTSICSTVGRGTQQHNAAPLEAEFEAGKTYWVGFDHNSPNRNDWKYVIWKVKD
ncbi:MAG: hypothetical protein KJN94_08985 [Gammaproteobacteria bacterium]|nr:hypothetical protein [Gammaproteobacteria bacterium]